MKDGGDLLYDAAVVGGGPAGATAALRMAADGLKVLLLEKSALPRYKTCGGGVISRASRLFPGSIGPVVEDECPQAELCLGRAGLEFRVRREQPIVFMTMRADLDQRLVQAAREAGATILSPSRLLALRKRTDSLELTTTRGLFQARFVIGADGALSQTARMAGWPKARGLIPALEWEIPADETALSRFRGKASFHLDAIPGGYAWIFPKKTHLSAGILTRRGRAGPLKAHLEAYLRSRSIGRTGSIESHGFVIPMRPRDPLVRGRVLLAGDAGGLADPVTGEGISFALLSGRLAGECITEGKLEPERVGELYRRRLSQQILAELRLARVLAFLLYESPRLRDLLFRVQGQALSEAMTDVMLGTRTYRTLLGNPLNYLRLLLGRPASRP